MFWFHLQIVSETFLILRKIKRDVVLNVCRSSCKVSVMFVRFYWNLNFLERFSKNTQISGLMTIRPVGAELFHADRRTDRHDGASSRFAQFCERAWKVFTSQIKYTNQSTMYISFIAIFSLWSPVHISVNGSLISAYVMSTKVRSRMRMFNVIYVIIFLWCL